MAVVRVSLVGSGLVWLGAGVLIREGVWVGFVMTHRLGFTLLRALCLVSVSFLNFLHLCTIQITYM